MCPPSHTRRSLLRAGGTITAIAAAGGLAGCLDGLGSSGPAGAPSDRLNDVPARADAVFTADVNTILADDAVRTAYNAWLEARAASGAYDGPTDLSSALDDLEQDAEFDLRDLSTFTAFGDFETEDGNIQDMHSGFIIEGSWSESQALASIKSRNLTYSEGSYGGHTVHEPDEEYGQTLGVLEEGTYVIGDRSLVEATLDVDSGEGESISGPVADAYHDARVGPIRFASSFPEGWIPEETESAEGTVDLSPLTAVETVAGGVYREGSTRGVAVDLHAPDASTAKELDDVMQTLLNIASTENTTTPAYVTELLADTDVSRDGATVTLTVERTVSELEEIATKLGERTAGAGGGREPPDSPEVSLQWDYDKAARTLRITHEAGDSVDAEALTVDGDGFADVESADMTKPGPWAGTTSDGVVAAGDSVVVGATPDHSIGLVWEGENGSALLGFHEGPER